MYESVDRVLLNGNVAKLQEPDQLRRMLCSTMASRSPATSCSACGFHVHSFIFLRVPAMLFIQSFKFFADVGMTRNSNRGLPADCVASGPFADWTPPSRDFRPPNDSLYFWS